MSTSTPRNYLVDRLSIWYQASWSGKSWLLFGKMSKINPSQKTQYVFTQRHEPNTQIPEKSNNITYEPTPDYCLVRSGYLSARTLLHYRKPLRLACCQTCQLIYAAIEIVEPRWRDENLGKKSIGLHKKETQANDLVKSSWTVFTVRLLEDGNSSYIKLALPTGMPDVITLDMNSNKKV